MKFEFRKFLAQHMCVYTHTAVFADGTTMYKYSNTVLSVILSTELRHAMLIQADARHRAGNMEFLIRQI